jgi:hypothetical protein
VTYGTWVRLWARELWINLTTAPLRILPHPCRPRWWALGGEYVCDRCGSSSTRVQRKGRAQAERLRRELA